MSMIGHGGGPGDAERDPGLDRLYREAAREEPPARLDAAILAAAHREVGARPRPLSARLHAWRVPLSIAAVMVLSVSLVTVVQEEGGERLAQPPAPLMEPAARNEAADPAKTLEKAPEQPAASASAPTPDAPTPAKAPRDGPSPAAARGRSADRAVAPQGEGDPVRSAPEAAPARPAEPAAPAAAPVPPTPFVRDEPLTPFSAPTSAGRGPGEGGASIEESRRPAVAAKPAPAPRSPARIMAREAAPRSDDRAGAGEDVAGALSSQAGSPAAGQPRARAEASARKAARPPDAAFVAAQLKELDTQPPERWIERIEALRREGRQPESDELLAELRRRFPDHPLPAGLRQAP